MQPRDGFYAFDPEDMLKDDPLVLWLDCPANERHVRITRVLMPTRPAPTIMRHDLRKLSDDEVKTIRASYRRGMAGYGLIALARRFGVARETVRNIVRNRYYRDVEAA